MNYNTTKDERWMLQSSKFSEYFRVLNSYSKFDDYRIKHEEESVNRNVYQSIIRNTGSNCGGKDLDQESNIHIVYQAIDEQIG